jgi:hypothetical protein
MKSDERLRGRTVGEDVEDFHVCGRCRSHPTLFILGAARCVGYSIARSKPRRRKQPSSLRLVSGDQKPPPPGLREKSTTCAAVSGERLRHIDLWPEPRQRVAQNHRHPA